MIYETAVAFEAERCLERVNFLIRNKRPIEVVDKSLRSLNQNNYLHLILGALAMDTGNTIEDVKREYFKRICNPEIFVIEKEDPILGRMTILKSSKYVSKEEMSKAIDKFKNWSAENGYALPEPGDKEMLEKIQIEMYRQSRYL